MLIERHGPQVSRYFRFSYPMVQKKLLENSRKPKYKQWNTTGQKDGKQEERTKAEVTMANYFPEDLVLFLLGNQLRFEKLQKQLYKLW